MSENTYYVNIIKRGNGKDTEVVGEISYSTQEYDGLIFREEGRRVEFNPLTGVGDLLSKDLPKKYETYLFDYVNSDERYEQFISELREKTCTTEELELLRVKYRIEIDCNIAVEADNPIYELLKKRNRYARQKEWKSLEYNIGKDNSDLLNEEYLKENHRFLYKCNNLLEIAFAILHFIIIHGYKLEICELCEKKFAKIPIQGQRKYCSRLSPLSSIEVFSNKKGVQRFENLDCQNSMKKYHEIIRNMKKNKITFAGNVKAENRFRDEYEKKITELEKGISVPKLVDMYKWLKGYDSKTKI